MAVYGSVKLVTEDGYGSVKLVTEDGHSSVWQCEASYKEWF